MTTAMRSIKRIAALLLGLAASITALVVLFLAGTDEATFSSKYPQYRVGLWSKIGVSATVAIAVVLCASIAYLLLRYAIVESAFQAGKKSAAVPFFASAAVASAAVVILGVLSQAVLLGVAAIKLRRVSTDSVGVRWSPLMWQATRDTPAFLAAALAVFVLTFFWQYRRSTRL